MIFYETTNFFDAKYPTLEDHEEEILYQHPEYDIKCNQLGVLDFGEDNKYGFTSREQYKIKAPGTKGFKMLGHKERIVMECYTGFSHKGKIIYFIDGNPLNHTFKNLICISRKGPEYRELYNKNRDFIDRSVQHMNSREPFIVKRGIEPEDYWTAMALPEWLMLEWHKSNHKTSKEIPVGKIPKGKYIKGDTQLDLLKQIWELKKSGYSWAEMMKETGTKSRSGFSYLLQKAETYFDI